MSIKQLKGQLDAAQARANEWEEKWTEERAQREDVERLAQQLKDHIQQLSLSGQQPLSASPLPVLLRASSSAAAPGDAVASSRRQSVSGAVSSVTRVSATGPGHAGLGVGGGNNEGGGGQSSASPRATYSTLPRPILVNSAMSSLPGALNPPSATPSPTHANGGYTASAALAASPSPTAPATASASVSVSVSGRHSYTAQPVAAHSTHLHTLVPAAFLSPAHSAPFISGSQPSTANSNSPSSASSNKSLSPAASSLRQRAQ